MAIRLLYVTAEAFPTFRADVTTLFGKYLPRLGVHSDLVAARDPQAPADARWGGGDARVCGASGSQARRHLLTLLHNIRQVLQATRHRYQAIQVRDLPVSALFALLAARARGLKFFYWMSFPVTQGQITRARARGLSAGVVRYLYPLLRGHFGHFVLYRLVLRHADHVFVQSERMRDDLTRLGVAAERMTPVPMGVDVEAMAGGEIAPSDDPRLAGKRVIVYLGSLDRPRQIEQLFAMMARVLRTHRDVLLVLVGDTRDDAHRDWLRRQAHVHGVQDAVLWTGWLPMIEAWRYVRAGEIGLSPVPRGPLYDCSSPTKIGECLVLGVPMVANDSPDQEKLLREGGGGRCVPYTPEHFADAVVELLDMDAAARACLAEQGRRYIIRERSYTNIAAALARVYEAQCGV